MSRTKYGNKNITTLAFKTPLGLGGDVLRKHIAVFAQTKYIFCKKLPQFPVLQGNAMPHHLLSQFNSKYNVIRGLQDP